MSHLSCSEIYIGVEVSSGDPVDDAARRLPGVLSCALECARSAKYASRYRPREAGITQLVESSWQCPSIADLASECEEAPPKGEAGPFVSLFMASLDPP